MAVHDEEEIRTIANSVTELEEELEVSGYVTVASDEVEAMKVTLREWVESVVGVVATPALGRVTLIHAGGGKSSITSPVLPFALMRRDKD